MAKVIDKFPKCATCIYATIGASGRPSCTIHRNKKHDCRDFEKPDTRRFEFKYDYYRLIVTEVNYYDTQLEVKRYATWLNAYLEPYHRTKKGHPIYIAHTKPYFEPKSENRLRNMAIESFETYYLGSIPKS